MSRNQAKYTVRGSFRIPPGLARKMRKYAAEQGIEVSKVIRRALERFLNPEAKSTISSVEQS